MRTIAERLAANRRTNHELNPALFNDEDKLKPEVREKVLQIVDEFIEYVDVSLKVIDVRLLGSNASYNYTDDSDLDIHIVTDLSKISEPETIARLYFDASKKNFKDTYDITIKGIEVEMYVEDINASAISNGIYSVTKDEWIKEPTPLGEPDNGVIEAAEKIEDAFIQAVEDTDSIEELEDLVDQLYLTRKDALAGEYGELSPGNLAFKSLRSKGILDKVKDTIKKTTSQRLSLESASIRESSGVAEWVGGHPGDDDLFHHNAERFGLEIGNEDIDVSGKSLDFDYVILKSPTLFYHATLPDRVESIKKAGILPNNTLGKNIRGVFFSGVTNAAYQWRGKNTVVVKVVLPAGTKVYQDRQSNAVFVKDKISADNIIGIDSRRY